MHEPGLEEVEEQGRFRARCAESALACVRRTSAQHMHAASLLPPACPRLQLPATAGGWEVGGRPPGATKSGNASGRQRRLYLFSLKLYDFMNQANTPHPTSNTLARMCDTL